MKRDIRIFGSYERVLTAGIVLVVTFLLLMLSVGAWQLMLNIEHLHLGMLMDTAILLAVPAMILLFLNLKGHLKNNMLSHKLSG